MKIHILSQKLINSIFTLSIFGILCIGCENREINSNENYSETYSDLPLAGIESHFQQVWLEDMQYFILERDRNNPHEGFGFMALKGNVLVNKQDSIIAYLQTTMRAQAEILALLKKTNIEEELITLESDLDRKLKEKKFAKN